MNATSISNQQGQAILTRYARLRRDNPSLRARDAAKALDLSEAELIAAHVGKNVTRLANDAPAILTAAKTLGKVMALTRNEHCVHERKGIYDNAEFFRHGAMSMGLFVNPDIDLRLFMHHWAHGFAVSERTKQATRQSLQFFDKAGVAIHKIYLTDASNAKAYGTLVQQYAHKQQTSSIDIKAYAPTSPDRPDDEIDWPAFRTAWAGLKDTHDFQPMLRQFRVGREQALRGIGSEFAYEVNKDAALRLLELARDKSCDIMVFVGNRGCIQIHTGPVQKLLEHQDWFNVLDPMFNLHLRKEAIARSWVTKKPTVDGIVTALEIYDAQSELIATLFGKRKPGLSELSLWRELVGALPAREPAHAA